MSVQDETHGTQPSAFASSPAADDPPALASPALRSIRWAAKGEWDKAHELVQEDGGADAAWVHAHLHRVEGDLANAAYWYRKAGRPVAQGDLDAERDAIAAALLKPA